MKKNVKYIILVITTIVVCFNSFIIAAQLSGVKDLDYPQTAILPVLAFFLFILAFIALCIWGFKFSAEKNHKPYLYMAIALMFIATLAMLLCSPVNKAISGHSASSKAGFSSPDKIEDYERADFEKFNSPADENGLGGTKIYIDGILDDISSDSLIYATLSDGQNKWSLWCGGEDGAMDPITFKKTFQGQHVRVFGIFNGFSESKKMPVCYCLKFTLTKTGESHHLIEFTKSGKDLFDHFEEPFIEDAKSKNPGGSATSDSFVTETIGDITLEMPSTWTKEEDKGYVYFYASNGDYLLIDIINISTLNDEYFAVMLDEIEKNNGEIQEHSKEEINGVTFYTANYLLHVGERQTQANMYTSVFNNKLYSFYMLSADNRSYSNEIKRILSSISTKKINEPQEPYKEPINSPKISLEEFNQLYEGITYEKATEIIGSSGKILSESSISGTTTKMYSWDGEGDIGANANALFQNGKLISKAQAGLR